MKKDRKFFENEVKKLEDKKVVKSDGLFWLGLVSFVFRFLGATLVAIFACYMVIINYFILGDLAALNVKFGLDSMALALLSVSRVYLYLNLLSLVGMMLLVFSLLLARRKLFLEGKK